MSEFTIELPASAAARGRHDWLPAELLDLAAARRGMFTTEMALRLGATKPTLARLSSRGVLRHPCRGLYAVAELVDSSAEAWHLHLAYGASLIYDDVVMTGATALLAQDIPVWNSDLSRPALLRPPDRSASASAFWVRPRVCESVASPWGRTEPMARAIVQHCLDNGIAQGVVSADAALRQSRVTSEQLQEEAVAVQSWPRSSRVRSMLTFVNANHESPGESLTDIFAGAAGIRLVPQVTITDDDGVFVARVDFVVEGTRVIVEFDGRLKYDGVDGSVLFDEKRREDRLRALGYIVVRIVWRDFYRTGAVEAKIRAGLRAAGVA